MKNTLNEIKSLMKRMEETPNGGSNYITESINEVTCKWRDVVGEENFYDLLAGLKPGNRVTFGYVSAAKVEVPKGKRLNVIKLTIYNLPWQAQNDVDSKYKNWKTIRNELGEKFGVKFGKARYGVDRNKFGNRGGISQYNGNNDKLTTHTYTNLNMSGIKPISTNYYLVMNDGHVRPIDINKFTLLPYKPSTSAIDKLKAAGATEQDIEPLLNMQYQRFEHSHVLFISATPDTGIPTLLINNKLSDKTGGISNINVEDIIELAKERYSKFMNTDVEFIKS